MNASRGDGASQAYTNIPNVHRNIHGIVIISNQLRYLSPVFRDVASKYKANRQFLCQPRVHTTSLLQMPFVSSATSVHEPSFPSMTTVSSKVPKTSSSSTANF